MTTSLISGSDDIVTDILNGKGFFSLSEIMNVFDSHKSQTLLITQIAVREPQFSYYSGFKKL